jgi:hypothetical protein
MRRILGVGAAVVVAAACLTAGCASMKTTEWTGHKIDEVIKELGPPSHITTGEDGRKIYEWTLHRTVPEPSESVDAKGNLRNSTAWRDSLHTWSFVVREDGTIVAWNDSQS